MAMYAKGMSQRDIEDTLREIYGTEVSQGMISKITDKILRHCQPDCVNVRIKFTNPSHVPKANQAYRE